MFEKRQTERTGGGLWSQRVDRLGGLSRVCHDQWKPIRVGRDVPCTAVYHVVVVANRSVPHVGRGLLLLTR